MSVQTEVSGADQRLVMVDALRGYALLGIALVHGCEMFELYWAAPKPTLTTQVVFGLFMSKSFSLLALCFGLSFFIIMQSAARRGVDFSLRFVWRLALLAAIGWLHGLLYKGDILAVLAPAGLVLLPLHRLRSNALLAVIGLLLLAQPQLWVQFFAAGQGAAWANAPPSFWSDTTLPTYMHGSLGEVLALNLGEGQASKWRFFLESGRLVQLLGLFVIGMVLGRIGFFHTPETFTPVRRLAGVGLALFAAGLHAMKPWLVSLTPTQGAPMAGPVLGMILTGYVDLAFMGALLMLFIEAFLSPAQALLRWLAPVGRMTLTLYVTQSLILIPVFYGFGLGLYASISQAGAVGVCLAVFLAQAWFAQAWFKGFHYGPLEWAWRAGTYLSLDVPFRRRGRA